MSFSGATTVAPAADDDYYCHLHWLRTAVNLGIGVGDARFRVELEAAEQAKKKGGRKRKVEQAQVGEQVDLF